MNMTGETWSTLSIQNSAHSSVHIQRGWVRENAGRGLP